MVPGRGANVHIPTKSDIEKCVSIGSQWIRIDVDWYRIEKSKRSYSWGDVDTAVSYAKSRGLQVYASIAYTPFWIASDIKSCPDSDNWSDFCVAIAKRYGSRIDVYGLWNEPNLEQYFKGSMRDYVDKVLKPGYVAIKSVSPSLVVAGGELSTASGSSWTSWFSEMAKQKKFYDVFSWHLYQDSAKADIFRFKWGKLPIVGWIVPKWQPILWYVSKIKKSHKRLMLTETGLKARSTFQGEMRKQLEFVKKLDEIRKSTKSEAIFYYDLKDSSQFKDKWGLFDDAGDPKLAAQWMMRK